MIDLYPAIDLRDGQVVRLRQGDYDDQTTYGSDPVATAVSFAQAGRAIPLLGTTHADYFHGPVPVTRALTADEINGDYEWETGNVIVECFAGADPLAVPAALVRNHGPFAWGPSGAKAVETAQALEIVAQMAWQSLSLDPAVPPAPDALRDKHYFRKHGSGAYYGQE